MRHIFLLFFLINVLTIELSSMPQLKVKLGVGDYSKKHFDIGLVKILFPNRDYYENHLQLFKDSTMRKPFDWNIKDTIIKPIFFFQDAEILCFSCITKGSNYYEVIISDSGESMYLPINNLTKFITWDKFLIGSFGVRRKNETLKDQSKQRLYKAPSEKSLVIEIPNEDQELLCVQDVKNEWIKVKYDCTYNTDEYLHHEGLPCKRYIDSCETSPSGWLKWRNNDSLLIELYLTP